MLTPEMVNEINGLQSKDECKEAWDLIKEKWNELDISVAYEARKLYKVGDEVVFQGRRHQRLRGSIRKLNPKKAKVFVHDTLEEWNVPYSMLNKFED